MLCTFSSLPSLPTLAGFNTALIERYDFSAGTSSRSTKLIHGGVRYLEKAIKQLDYEQYKLVKEALHERANLLQIAPHLSSPLPIMLPVYKYKYTIHCDYCMYSSNTLYIHVVIFIQVVAGSVFLGGYKGI